jgi:hypothetical protein
MALRNSCTLPGQAYSRIRSSASAERCNDGCCWFAAWGYRREPFDKPAWGANPWLPAPFRRHLGALESAPRRRPHTRS